MGKDFQNILALDTAMQGCGVCVYRTDKDRAFVYTRAMPRGQAEHLVPMIEEAMKDAGLDYDALDVIAVTAGPGAFTGLRIGLSTARALGQALDIPVRGITTLQVLACQYVRAQKPEQAFAVIIETKREDFYVQGFDKDGHALSEPDAMTADRIWEQAEDKDFVGDGCRRFKAIIPQASVIESFDRPDPEIMARILKENQILYLDNSSPIYLREADTSKPRKSQRVIV